MKYSKESLDSLLARVRQERISVQHGSPSDAEIGQAQLADMATDYLPGLVECVLGLSADLGHYNKVLAHAERFDQGLTHAEVANKVRMLTRGDLDHEMVCVLARDRIIGLAKELSDATARATQAESRLAELRGSVTNLLEDLANGCVPVRGEAGKATTPYWLAVNSERARTLAWAELKCKELGIGWPIKPIPYVGNLPSAAPTPLPSSPAAAGPGEAEVSQHDEQAV